MFRPLSVNVGLRYARSRRSFISFVSVLALAGLVLAVAILLFVQAVVAGFEEEMRHRVLGTSPHVTVLGRVPVADIDTPQRLIEGVPGVRAATPVVVGTGLLATRTKVAGASLAGVVPERYGDVSRIFEFAGGATLRSGGFDILVGAQLAERLGLGVGDSVAVVLPTAIATPLGAFPRHKRFRVAGVVDTGSQLDRFSAYLHRDDAAKLFRLGDRVHGFHVALADALQAGEMRARIIGAVGAGRYRVGTWMATFGALYNAIEVTRGMLFLLLSLLVAVAAFNLVSSLVMIVNERRGDIAMLRTMGSRLSTVACAFLMLGMVIAGIGVGLGIGFGALLGVLAEQGFPWLEALLGTPLMSEYLVTSLPVSFVIDDILLVAVTAFALCLAATLVPAWRAARLNPADVLRHE